jgi:hypothetical protein
LRRLRPGGWDEIKYVVAYHCGAFPPGLPVRLLKGEEEMNAFAEQTWAAPADAVGRIARPLKVPFAAAGCPAGDGGGGGPAARGWSGHRLAGLAGDAENRSVFPHRAGCEGGARLYPGLSIDPMDVTPMTAPRRGVAPGPAPAVRCSCGLYGLYRFRDCVTRLLEISLDRDQLLGDGTAKSLTPKRSVRVGTCPS